MNVKETLENDPEAYYSKEELVEPLLIMYNSLIETEDDSIANGRLLDVIRQVSTAAVPFVTNPTHPASSTLSSPVAHSAREREEHERHLQCSLVYNGPGRASLGCHAPGHLLLQPHLIHLAFTLKWHFQPIGMGGSAIPDALQCHIEKAIQ